MSTCNVAEGSRVSIFFALKLDDGSVVDSNFDKAPAQFTVGDGNLLPGFELLLLGMSAGQKQSFVVKPEQGFGQANPNNIQSMKRDTFAADLELAEGLVVSFADAQKTELPGVIKSFNDDEVIVDFNHPLAGQDIVFDVEIVSVEPALQ